MSSRSSPVYLDDYYDAEKRRKRCLSTIIMFLGVLFVALGASVMTFYITKGILGNGNGNEGSDGMNPTLESSSSRENGGGSGGGGSGGGGGGGGGESIPIDEDLVVTFLPTFNPAASPTTSSPSHNINTAPTIAPIDNARGSMPSPTTKPSLTPSAKPSLNPISTPSPSPISTPSTPSIGFPVPPSPSPTRSLPPIPVVGKFTPWLSTGAPTEAPPAITDPTDAPSPAPPGTPQPTIGELKILLSSVSYDGGAALSDSTSDQHLAMTWLHDSPLYDTYTQQQKIQRYALAALYFGLNGGQWINTDGWLLHDTECSFSGGNFHCGGNECQWYGITCNSQGQVSVIRLPQNRLSGRLLPEISLLHSSLEILDLSRNYIRGIIPISIVDLQQLRELRLQKNKISGIIPPNIGLMTNLVHLVLRDNQIQGEIPMGIEQLHKLELLNLWTNELHGPIPPGLGSLQFLQFINIWGNHFEGRVPDTLGQLSNLERMYLHQNNFSGDMPQSICNLLYDGALNTLEADCAGDPPMLNCTCCTWCD